MEGGGSGMQEQTVLYGNLGRPLLAAIAHHHRVHALHAFTTSSSPCVIVCSLIEPHLHICIELALLPHIRQVSLFPAMDSLREDRSIGSVQRGDRLLRKSTQNALRDEGGGVLAADNQRTVRGPLCLQDALRYLPLA